MQMELVEKKEHTNDEGDLFEAIDKLIPQWNNGKRIQMLRDAGIYTWNGWTIQTTKKLTVIRVLSERELDEKSELSSSAEKLPINMQRGIGKIAYIGIAGTFSPPYGIVENAEKFSIDARAVLDNTFDALIAICRVDFTNRDELEECQVARILSPSTKIAKEFSIVVYRTNEVIADPGIWDAAAEKFLAHATRALMFSKVEGEQGGYVLGGSHASNITTGETVRIKSQQTESASNQKQRYSGQGKIQTETVELSTETGGEAGREARDGGRPVRVYFTRVEDSRTFVEVYDLGVYGTSSFTALCKKLVGTPTSIITYVKMDGGVPSETPFPQAWSDAWYDFDWNSFHPIEIYTYPADFLIPKSEKVWCKLTLMKYNEATQKFSEIVGKAEEIYLDIMRFDTYGTLMDYLLSSYPLLRIRWKTVLSDDELKFTDAEKKRWVCVQSAMREVVIYQ